MGKGPSSVSVYFLSTITSQNFEEPIRLRKYIGSNRCKSVWAGFGDDRLPTVSLVLEQLSTWDKDHQEETR